MEQKITKIQAQKRNPNRVNIYLDGEYAFSLARVIAGWLQTGQAVDERKITELKKQDGGEKAFQKALSLVGYRPRSEQEVRKKLEILGYSSETIEQTLERLRRADILNDKKFAQEWIENRSVFRPRSRRMMAMELRYKGVPEETVEQVIIESDEDENLAYAAAQKRFHRFENLGWEEFRKKLSDYLRRRGFRYETVSTVVRRMWSEIETTDKVNLNE